MFLTSPKEPQSGSTEKRQNPRAEICLLVEQPGNGQAYYDKIRDISESGAFIETESPLNVGEKIIVRFALPGSSPITLEAQVVRSIRRRTFFFKKRHPGMGIRFLAAAEIIRQDLATFVSVA